MNAHIQEYVGQTQTQTHTHTHTRTRPPCLQVSEPLAASEQEYRRTVTQGENVSPQYGKQSSHHSDGDVLSQSVGSDAAAFICCIC